MQENNFSTQSWVSHPFQSSGTYSFYWWHDHDTKDNYMLVSIGFQQSHPVNVTLRMRMIISCNMFNFAVDVLNNDSLTIQFLAFIMSNHLLHVSGNQTVVSTCFGSRLREAQKRRADTVLWLSTVAAMLTCIFWIWPRATWAFFKLGASFSCVSSCNVARLHIWSSVTVRLPHLMTVHLLPQQNWAVGLLCSRTRCLADEECQP